MDNDCFNELTMAGNKRDLDVLEVIFQKENPRDYLMPFPTELFDMIETVLKRKQNSSLQLSRALYCWGSDMKAYATLQRSISYAK